MRPDLFPAQSSFWGPFLDNRLHATLLLGIYSLHLPLASLALPRAYSHPPLLAIIATPGNTGSNGEDSFVLSFTFRSMSCN